MRAATTRCVRRAWSERVMDGAACGYPLPEGASARYAHPSCFMLIRHMTKIWHAGLAMKAVGWVA